MTLWLQNLQFAVAEGSSFKSSRERWPDSQGDKGLDFRVDEWYEKLFLEDLLRMTFRYNLLRIKRSRPLPKEKGNLQKK